MKATELFSTKFLSKVSDDEIFRMAASLAYYTALSLSPLLILLISFLSSLGPTFKTELVNEIHALVGGQAAEALSILIQNADRGDNARGISNIIGFLTLLVSAGGIFQELRMSLNKIFEAKELAEEAISSNVILRTSIGFLKQKIFNMGMVLTFVFILIISLVISSVISLWLTGTQQIVGQIINFVISTVIFTTLFGAIYYFLPQKKISFQLAATSGLFTAFLFSFGKTLIGLYLGESAVASAYGAAGSMIVLLMWVYYSSIIIFISAEISHQIEVVQNNGKNI